VEGSSEAKVSLKNGRSSSYSDALIGMYTKGGPKPDAEIKTAVVAVGTMPDPRQTEIFENSFLPTFSSAFPKLTGPGLANVAFACFEKLLGLVRGVSSTSEAKDTTNQASNDDTKAIISKLPNSAGDAFTALFVKFIEALKKHGVINNNTGEVKNTDAQPNLLTELMQLASAFRALFDKSIREQIAPNDTTVANKDAQRDNKEEEEKRKEEEDEEKRAERGQEAKAKEPENKKDLQKEAEQKRLADMGKREEIKFSTQRKQMQQQWKSKEQKKEQTIKKDVASFEQAKLRATAWKDKSFGDKMRTIGLSITDRLTGQSGKNNNVVREGVGSGPRSERPEAYRPIYVQKGALKNFAAEAKRDEDSYAREMNARTAFRQKFDPAAGQYEIEFQKFHQLQSALDARKATGTVADPYGQLGVQPAFATDSTTGRRTQSVEVNNGQIEEAYQQKMHEVLVKHGVIHDADRSIDLNTLDKTTYNNVMNDLAPVHQAYKQLANPAQKQAADQAAANLLLAKPAPTAGAVDTTLDTTKQPPQQSSSTRLGA